MKWGFLSLGFGTYDAASPYNTLLGGTQSSVIFLMEHLRSAGEDITFWNVGITNSNLKGIKHIDINHNSRIK